VFKLLHHPASNFLVCFLTQRPNMSEDGDFVSASELHSVAMHKTADLLKLQEAMRAAAERGLYHIEAVLPEDILQMVEAHGYAVIREQFRVGGDCSLKPYSLICWNMPYDEHEPPKKTRSKDPRGKRPSQKTQNTEANNNHTNF
jgi:hypothetical protein